RSSLASAVTKACAALGVSNGPTSRRLVLPIGAVQAECGAKSLGAFAFRRAYSRGSAERSEATAICTQDRLGCGSAFGFASCRFSGFFTGTAARDEAARTGSGRAS